MAEELSIYGPLPAMMHACGGCVHEVYLKMIEINLETAQVCRILYKYKDKYPFV